jgi:biopolymer transport protein ExbB/TolQ
MAELFSGGGYMMWPLLLIGVGILVLVVRTAVALRAPQTGVAVQGRLQSLLFWGGMSFLLGLLGTVIGQIQISAAISAVGSAEVELSTLWTGIAVTLITLLFGILLLIFSLFSWYVLRFWAARVRPV